MSLTKRRSKKSLNGDSFVSLRQTSPSGSSPSGSSTGSKNAWHEGNKHDVDENPRAQTETKLSESTESYVMPADGGEAEETNEAVGWSTRLKRGVRALWKTRLTDEDDGDREKYLSTTLRELLIYLVFLLILCILTFGMTNPTMFYFTKVMKGLLVDSPDFNNVQTTEAFWTFVEGGFLDGLYWEKYYNGRDVPYKEKGYVYFENKILGRPRIRQVRVRNDSCKVHSEFRRDITECFSSYTPSVEDKRSFGLMNGTAWEYQTASELNGKDVWGLISTYGGGGFTKLFTDNKADTAKILAVLKQNLWIDRGTRVVLIDLSVYNANINLFCIITLVFEFPATGGIVPHAKFSTLKLLRYVNTMDHFVMACEGIFIIFLLYYTIEEGIEIKKHGIGYIKDFWNILDIVVLSLGYVCIVVNLYRTFSVSQLLKELLNNHDQYANFEVLAHWQQQFNDIVAIAVFISWVKIFKYISFNKTMAQLQSTLTNCAGDIAGFAIMFFIVFLAYAQWGYLIFGTQIKDYSTYLNCIFTLFRIILGNFNFTEMEDAHRILGPIFFITYVFFVFFVLINMFLAIINDTYAEVKSDLEEQEEELEMGDYFKKGYDKMKSKLTFKREQIVDIQKALQITDTKEDTKLDFDETREQLKALGYADAEIEAMFAKNDTDGDRVLNAVEQKQMQADFENQKNELSEEIEEVGRAKKEVASFGSKLSMRGEDDSESESGGGIDTEEFTVLSRRVDRVEHSVGSIVSKIDAFLVKLEAMDKAKIKRRDTMTKLLDSIAEQITQEDTEEHEKTSSSLSVNKRSTSQLGSRNKELNVQSRPSLNGSRSTLNASGGTKDRPASVSSHKSKGSSVSIKMDPEL